MPALEYLVLTSLTIPAKMPLRTRSVRFIPEHVAPLEGEKLAAAEPRGEVEDNHRAEGLIELFE
jgi:hypothetical protein